MQSVGDRAYKKYSSLRGESSKWSEKNKALVEELEEQGIMTNHGRKKIEEARENDQWDTPKPPAVTEDQVATVTGLLKGYGPVYTSLPAMSQPVKKTCTRAYSDARTDAGREKRTIWMVDRLNRDLKPM